MSFSAIKLAGWAFGEILTSAQMNYLNGALPQAIDGAAGGTYNNSTEIRLGGAFRVDGSLYAATTAAIDGACTVGGAISSGSTITSASDANVGGALSVVGNASCAALHATGDATFDANVTLGNATSDVAIVTGALRLSVATQFATSAAESGRVPNRILIGTDTGTTGSPQLFTAQHYDEVIFPAGTLSANRFWKVDESTSACGDGDHFAVYNGDAGSNSIEVRRPDNTAIGTVAAQARRNFSKKGGTWYFAG